jgi:hypothetical protein
VHLTGDDLEGLTVQREVIAVNAEMMRERVPRPSRILCEWVSTWNSQRRTARHPKQCNAEGYVTRKKIHV